jgi:LysR family transcriptional regulator, hydrogen peroxide-inducible genes activator
MQICELENQLAAELMERRQGATALTALGVEVAKRAGDILSAVRDPAECVRHGDEALTGRLWLGVIPTLAPYVLPRMLPALTNCASIQRNPDQGAASRAASRHP